MLTLILSHCINEIAPSAFNRRNEAHEDFLCSCRAIDSLDCSRVLRWACLAVCLLWLGSWLDNWLFEGCKSTQPGIQRNCNFTGGERMAHPNGCGNYLNCNWFK